MRVLIVDDSIVFRSQIKSALEGIDGIEVVGVAAHGRIAIEKLEQTQVDLMTLDLEMPEMNGIETLLEMKKRKLTQKVIVFAAVSQTGANLAMEALKAGAEDFVIKPESSSLNESLEKLKSDLIPKILQFARAYNFKFKESSVEKNQIIQTINKREWVKVNLSTFSPSAIAIGSSTGGPTALEKIFLQIKGHKIRPPIFIVQHMPPIFTASLAISLAKISGLTAMEAKHGEQVKMGNVYVAPGDYHMTLNRTGTSSHVVIQLDQESKINSVRPSVDKFFTSFAKTYGGMGAGMILTGMGEDGKQGCIEIKNASGGIMIQNESSSVVWGMPGAVYDAGAFDKMGSIDECAKILLNLTR